MHTCPVAHFVPQAPQFWGSVWKLVQMAVVPVPQAFGVVVGQAQVLFVQACPAGQTFAQAPQLLASFVRLAQ